MAATDNQIVVSAIRWKEEGQYLREFVGKNKLPAVVKIIKGQYAGLGVPTLPNPGLHSTALLASAGKRHKILAQAIKIKDGRRIVGIGPRFAIPDTYSGYFELLSEEGRAMRCIESVSELARRRLETGCLVRDSIRCIIGKYDSNGNLVADGARIINAGEILYPDTQVQLDNSKTKLLRCSDSSGDIILLGFDQKGRFSALAKEDNISGVHTAKNLLTKRLPVTVRLVHGTPPRGLKNLHHFTPELRLLSAYEEEHVFAMPIQQKDANSSVIALPLSTPLKLQKAKNEDSLNTLREYQRLVDKCSKLVSEVADRAHVFDGKLAVDWKAFKMLGNGAAGLLSSKAGGFLRRSISSDSADAYGGRKYHHAANNYSNISRNNSENKLQTLLNDEYDEIDQIYDYVRGFAPLPKHIRSPFSDIDSPVSTSSSSHDTTTTPAVSNNSSYKNNLNSHTRKTNIENNDISCNNNNNNNLSNNLNKIDDNRKIKNNRNNSTSTNSSSSIQDLENEKIITINNDNNNIVFNINKESHNNYPQLDLVKSNNSTYSNIKPEPPPIETIPSKKLPITTTVIVNIKDEKMNHRRTVVNNKETEGFDHSSPTDKSYSSAAAVKLFVKNGYSQSRRLLRQKSSSPLKEYQPLMKTGSPIFNIRYKSLNNLQAAVELDCGGGGTLNSSHSGGGGGGGGGTAGGGKICADSAAVKLPDKRSKRLSRPRSLTNLVWDLRNEVELNNNNSERKFKPIKFEPSIYKKTNNCQKNNPCQKRIGTLYL